MAHLVPACSFCHKNLDLQRNKPNFERPEITVISVPCGHLFHRTCISKLFGDKKILPCKNPDCDENIERIRLKEVNFETITSPDAPTIAELQAIIDGYKRTTKANRTEITKLTTNDRKRKEEDTIKSSQFKNLEVQNSKLVDENKKLQTKNEEYLGKIRRLRSYRSKLDDVEKLNSKIVDENKELQTENELYKSQLESVEKQNFQLIDQNRELQNKTDECNEMIEKLKPYKSKLVSVEKQNFQLIDQNNELRNKNDKCNETIEKLKASKSKLETVEKQKLQLIDQNKELRNKNDKFVEAFKKMKLYIKSKHESAEKEKLQLIDQNKELRTKNDECNETMETLKLHKSKLESVEKENSKLVDENKELQSENKLHRTQLENVEKVNLQLINQNEELRTKNDNYNKTIEKLKLHKSRLESVENENLLLVNQNKKLHTKNEQYIKTLEKVQKCIADTRNIDETPTNCVIVDLKHENGEKIPEPESKIEMDENLDENNASVKMNYDDEKFVETLSIDEVETDEEESPKVPSTVLGEVESEKDDHVITDPSDQAKSDAKFVEPLTSGKSPELRANQKQDKSHPFLLNELVTRHQKTTEIQISTYELSPSPQHTSQETKESQICESDRIYQDRKTKKRTWDEVQGQEYDNILEYNAKKRKENSSSPQQEYLGPFFFTGRTFGPFKQVIYDGNFAYTSGEYLLLGDGVIYLILRTALQTDEYLNKLLKKSPYYFKRQSVKELNCRLANLPFLPKKVMISIGDIDSVTSDLSYDEIREALQSLFNTVYQKGVKEIIMIPPMKYSKWSERQCDLEFFLKIKACTTYYWKYYYMQELAEVMSNFTTQIKRGDTYNITDEDILKLTETITNYTAGN